MKTNKLIKGVILGMAVVTIVGCSSTKKNNSGNAGGYLGGAGYDQGAYGAGQTYGQGGEGGYYNDPNCNIPAGSQAYYFDFDSNAIHSEDRGRLQSLAQSANANHEQLRVVGNTDNRGSREYNVALGWRRADAVSSALEQYGVSKQQIATTSNGAEKPVAYGNSENDYQCNRRVDAQFGR
jgi:peptidoglycan-associated lipoprotein